MDDRSETTSPRPSHRVRLLMEAERTVAETAVDRAHQRSDRITGAVMVLREEPASWFYRPKDPRGAFDAGILEALGRIGAPAALRDTARALAALPPMPTEEARRWIRAARDPSPEGAQEVSGLLRTIAGAIDAYRQVHPGTTWSAVGEALEQALSFAEEAEDAREPSPS
jgi:hypothetical protein